MKFINNLKIRDKLLLLLFLLLIPLTVFVALRIKSEIKENRELEEIVLKLTESGKLSTFIHEFQKERAKILAATAGNRAFLLEAKEQRRLTDAAAEDLKIFLEESERDFEKVSLINELEQYRYQADRNNLDLEAYSYYNTNLLNSFLNRIEENATGIATTRGDKELISFKNLIEAKVQLGRIRTILIKAINEGKFSYQDYATFIYFKNLYSESLDNFNRNASGNAIERVEAILASDNYNRIASLTLLLENNPQYNLSALNATETFNLFTVSVEDLGRAEDAMISNLRNEVQEESDQKKRGLVLVIGFMLLTLGLAVVLSFYIIDFISGSLTKLKKAADRIKLGATDVEISIESEDEIGEVADSFRGVVQKNIALTNVAKAIGEGNYDVEVEAQSQEDVLSFAIREMKNNLYDFTSSNKNRNWILTGIAELNNIISSETTLEQLSEKGLSFLCAYTGSEAGVLYLHDDAGMLIPAASNGVKFPLDKIPAFNIGTGKLGQAVSDQQIEVLEDVPAEYLKISTGLSETAPANVIIIPLLFSSTIVGAIELCSRQKFNELHHQFFKAISDRIALVAHTLKSHVKTQELLYETQNQAEELETQQEELRQLNAELKASEEELRVSQEELQEKNAELEEKAQLLEEQYEALGTKNKALEEAREAIELKMQQVETVSKYKSEFLANMSHELRTPLNSILILSRLLADNKDQNLSSKQAEHAQIIHKSGSDLLKLINEILDLSKIESGMIRLELEDLKIDKISLASLFEEQARDKNIDYREEYLIDGVDTITTDRFRLEQILKNLVGNAIKFTEEGGNVDFSVYPVKKRPRFSSDQLRDQPEIIAFSVKDTGIGIPKDKQALIFEAFQQADASTTRKYGGTGLGLAISRELASLLGGEILLESQAGVGSTFTLYLPRNPVQEVRKVPVRVVDKPVPVAEKVEALAEPKKTAQAMPVMERISSAAGKEKKEISVLIIEDDKGFNGILADFAHAKNFKVFQAYTGNEGLDLARAEMPDAVLLDINLPDISGWDVLQKIREDKDLRHINVHLMSAYDREVMAKFQENEDYLPKPVTLDMLNKAFTNISGLSDKSIETILIVEDNEIENKAIGELLLAHDFRSTSAYSAEEAERVLSKQKIDCVILDLNLPGMKGHEWMEKIRAKKGLSELPIIIYSGKDLSEEEEARLKKFANTIIIKNEFSYLRLLDEVQLFLHKVNQKLPLGNDFKMKLHVPEEILKDKKALIVDDDVRNVYSLSSLLELQGMNIVVAYDGKEALQKLQTEKGIDIVLMDIMMPEMDGIEAITHIREDYQFKKLPVIALTAKAMKEDKDKCIKAGASDYIPKPVDTDKLLTLMRVWLYEA